MARTVLHIQCIRKYGVVAMVLWAYSLKKGEFHHFTVMVRVSSVTAMVSVSVTIRVRFSFSNRVGIGLSDVQ